MAQAPAPVEHGPTPLDQGDVDFNFYPPPSRKFTLYHQFLNVSNFNFFFLEVVSEFNPRDDLEVTDSLMAPASPSIVGSPARLSIAPGPADSDIEDVEIVDYRQEADIDEIEVSPIKVKQEKKAVEPPSTAERMVTRGQGRGRGKSTLEGVVITSKPHIRLGDRYSRSLTPPPVPTPARSTKKAKGKGKQKDPAPKTPSKPRSLHVDELKALVPQVDPRDLSFATQTIQSGQTVSLLFRLSQLHNADFFDLFRSFLLVLVA